MPRTHVREAAAKVLVGARIRAARKAAGMSQTALATAVGRPQGVISDWEKGHRRVSYLELWKLVQALGISLDRLLGPPVGPGEEQLMDAEADRLERMKRGELVDDRR